MNFWGVEVNSGQHVVVQPGNKMLLHVSQACLGGIKKDKGSEYVRLYAKKDGKKFVLGILSPEKFPQLNFDLVFEDDFELSHDGKNESVHFTGYRAMNLNLDEEENESDDSDGERVPMKALDNGTSETKEDAAAKIIAPSKPEAAAGKAKVKIVEPNKDAKQSEDSDDSDDSDSDDSNDNSDDSNDDSDEHEDVEGERDEDNSDEDSEDDEIDEETPKKTETSKKRTAEAPSKTSGPDKKAKFATPVKNDKGGKKPVPHVATPYPSKQAGKLPANNDKPKQQTPKSSGSFACNSCNRSFGSEQALQSHSKAKHAAK